MPQRIRLMTHNVWDCDENLPRWKERGEDCSAQCRSKGILRVYRETMPDIVGAQEMSAMMTELLTEGFCEAGLRYAFIFGRCTPIFYRADKLELLDSYFGIYPESVPGLVGSFNNSKTKSWSIAVFREKRTLKTFIFASTHLWWKASPKCEDEVGRHGVQRGSNEAREWQIDSLTDRILQLREKYDCPAILVGDMNCGYESSAMALVRSKGFCHAHDLACEYRDETVGYHYCFPDGFESRYYDTPFVDAIDHIYLIGMEAKSVKRFERYSPEYYYPISDHSAAFVDVEI